MNDEYIRRVEAEEAIEEYCCRMCKEYSEVEGGCVSHAQYCEHLSGEEILKSVKSADVQPAPQWISIEESKPKDMQRVLAVVDGDVREAFYNEGCFIGSNFYRSINEVKWWQPLPEPPKDGDTECQ